MKNYVSNFTSLIATKLGRVLPSGKKVRTRTPKSSSTSCSCSYLSFCICLLTHSALQSPWLVLTDNSCLFIFLPLLINARIARHALSFDLPWRYSVVAEFNEHAETCSSTTKKISPIPQHLLSPNLVGRLFFMRSFRS